MTMKVVQCIETGELIRYCDYNIYKTLQYAVHRYDPVTMIVHRYQYSQVEYYEKIEKFQIHVTSIYEVRIVPT